MKLKSILFVSSLLVPASTLAQTIELRSPDGLFAIEGELIDFSDGSFTVQTSVGVAKVAADQVVCYGVDCPEGSARVAVEEAITIATTEGRQTALVDALINGFARSNGAEVDTQDGDNGAKIYAFDDEATATAASITLNDEVEGASIVIEAADPKGPLVEAYDNATLWAGDDPLPKQLIALDAFSIVVSSDVAVTGLSVEQIAKIFSGEITNWSEVGGTDLAIFPLLPDPESENARDFTALVMEPSGSAPSEDVLSLADDAEIINAVNEFPGAIGFVGLDLDGNGIKIPVDNGCGIPTLATPFSIHAGDYPLTRAVMAHHMTDESSKLSGRIFERASLISAQASLDEQGYLSTTFAPQNSDQQAKRMSDLLVAQLDEEEKKVARVVAEIIFNADRLPISFQHTALSEDAAAWNRANLQRLVAEMQSGALDGYEIIFAGVTTQTDGEDAYAESLASARAVRGALLAYAPEYQEEGAAVTVSAVGFGTVSKTTCVGSQFAGNASDRVEVWVKRAEQ
jgi:ABC-type phosphate transport system substrate-binding protein